MSDLPENWVQISLGDIATVTSGIGFPLQHQGLKSGELPFFKVGDVSRAFLNNRGNLTVAQHHVSSEMAKKLHGKPIQPGSTVFAKIGEALKLNRRAYVQSPCLIDNNVMAVKAHDSRLDRYVYFFLMASDLTEFSRATTVPSLRKGDIESLKFPLPPLNEQKRIAEKLDTLLARVDSCQTHLERVPQILKRFRQSVLAAATSGRLTQEWREEKGIANSRVTNLGEIIKVSSGKFLPAKSMAKNGKIPVFGGNGITGYHDQANVSVETLVIGRVGFYCGSIHMTPINAWITDNALIVSHDESTALKRFLFYALQGIDLRVNDSSTAQPVISGQKIYPLRILIPDVKEQAEIVRRVEKLFAFADRLEARYYSASEQIERLTPSLLAKAFRGELVEQEQT